MTNYMREYNDITNLYQRIDEYINLATLLTDEILETLTANAKETNTKGGEDNAE